jgi:hypothetical protein
VEKTLFEIYGSGSIDMNAPCRCEVCNRMNLKKESAVVRETDLARKVQCPSDESPLPVEEEECGAFPERGPIECRRGKPLNLERRKSRDGVGGWKVLRG